MKNRVMAFGRFLLGFCPFWLPSVLLIPYLWSVPKEELPAIINLPLMVAALLAAVYSLFLGGIVLWKGAGKEKGLPMGKLLLSNVLDAVKLYGVVMAGGLWVAGSALLLKEVIFQPRKIGELLFLLPLALLVYEGKRFMTRKKEIDQAFAAANLQQAKRKWLVLAGGQSLVIMGLWLGIVAGGLLLINSLGKYSEETPNTLPAIILILATTFVGLPFLRLSETWAHNKGHIPWLSGYGRWKDWIKD